MSDDLTAEDLARIGDSDDPLDTSEAAPALLRMAGECLALRASFASQAQVTATARQAVSDVVVQRDVALAEVARLRAGVTKDALVAAYLKVRWEARDIDSGRQVDADIAMGELYTALTAKPTGAM